MSSPVSPAGPLAGTVVVDLSRMLPGAVAVRILVDLGARVVKVEEPGTGDPMRVTPPLAGGVGAGFAAFFRGTESVCLDLRRPDGAGAFRRLVSHADVLLESFRPGTLERWGISLARLEDDTLELRARLLSVDGKIVLEKSDEGPAAAFADLAHRVAADLRARGADRILADSRNPPRGGR